MANPGLSSASQRILLLRPHPLAESMVGAVYTVEPLLKDTPNKGHNTFYLSVKDKFCGPYSIMAIQSYLLKRTTSL